MKRLFVLIVPILITCASSACKDSAHSNQEVIVTIGDFGPAKSLLPSKTESIAPVQNPFWIIDCGDFLVSHDEVDNHAYIVIRKSDLRVATLLCPIGEGPEEYLDPMLCFYSYENKILSIFDPDKSLLTTIDIDKSVETDSTVVDSRVSFVKTGKRIHRLFTAVSGDRLAYVFEGLNFAFYRVSPEKQLMDTDLCSSKINLLEKNKSQELYVAQSLQAFDEKKGVFFAAYSAIPRFDLIDIKNGCRKKIFFERKVSPDQAAEILKERNTRYTWSIAYNAEHVYVGYYMDAQSYEEDNSTHILVFDWEGNPVKHLVLPIPAKSFAVSQDGKKLYTLNESETQPNSISVYDIK